VMVWKSTHIYGFVPFKKLWKNVFHELEEEISDVIQDVALSPLSRIRKFSGLLPSFAGQ